MDSKALFPVDVSESTMSVKATMASGARLAISDLAYVYHKTVAHHGRITLSARGNRIIVTLTLPRAPTARRAKRQRI